MWVGGVWMLYAAVCVDPILMLHASSATQCRSVSGLVSLLFDVTNLD